MILKLSYDEDGGDDEEPMYFNWLWSLQNPLVSAFWEVKPVRLLPVDEAWGHRFEGEPLAFRVSSDLDFDAKFHIEVLPDVQEVGEGIVAANGHWLSWDDFADQYFLEDGQGVGVEEGAVKKRPRLADIDPTALASFPWLLDIFGSKTARAGTAAPVAPTCVPPTETLPPMAVPVAPTCLPPTVPVAPTCLPPTETLPPIAEDELDIEEEEEEVAIDVEAAMEDLRNKRMAEAADDEREVVHFARKLRGGRWCLMETGRPYDSFRVQGVTRSAQAFLYKYRFQKSWTFNLSMGEIPARLLADYLVFKLEVWHRKWVSEGSGSYVFTPACLAETHARLFFSAADLVVLQDVPRFVGCLDVSPGHPR